MAQKRNAFHSCHTLVHVPLLPHLRFYFCSYTMTSVGYGDLGPKNIEERTVCTIMILTAGLCWAYVLGVLTWNLEVHFIILMKDVLHSCAWSCSSFFPIVFHHFSSKYYTTYTLGIMVFQKVPINKKRWYQWYHGHTQSPNSPYQLR